MSVTPPEEVPRGALLVMFGVFLLLVIAWAVLFLELLARR